MHGNIGRNWVWKEKWINTLKTYLTWHELIQIYSWSLKKFNIWEKKRNISSFLLHHLKEKKHETMFYCNNKYTILSQSFFIKMIRLNDLETTQARDHWCWRKEENKIVLALTLFMASLAHERQKTAQVWSGKQMFKFKSCLSFSWFGCLNVSNFLLEIKWAYLVFCQFRAWLRSRIHTNRT